MAEGLDAYLPFSKTARDVREVIDALGNGASTMEAVYDDAIRAATILQSNLRARGNPERMSDRDKLEYNLILGWMQLCEQFASQYLQLTLVQGAQIAREPKGPRPVDVRDMQHRPDRGRLQ